MLYSVVIGIDSYSDSRITNLACARNDAAQFARMLTERVKPSERSVQLLVDEQATRLGIVKAIGEDLPRIQSIDDFILLYFAGHGSPETSGAPDEVSRYLVPHDANYDSIFATGIDLERELRTLLERQRAARVVLILDACFSGLAGGRTFCGASLKKLLVPFRSAQIGLRELNLGEGRAILAACKDDQLAREDPQRKHGIFTYCLIETLTAPGGATVTVTALYDQLYRRVCQETRGEQLPVLRGEFVGLSLPRFVG